MQIAAVSALFPRRPEEGIAAVSQAQQHSLRSDQTQLQKHRTYKSTPATQSVWLSFIREVLYAFIIFPYRLSLIRVLWFAKTTQLVKVTLAELKVNHQNGRWMKQSGTVKERKNSFSISAEFPIHAKIDL